MILKTKEEPKLQTIKINGSVECSVTTGRPYEVVKPHYTIEKSYQIPDEYTEEDTSIFMIRETQALNMFLEKRVKESYEQYDSLRTRQDVIEEHGHRLMVEGKELWVPRVTSIITPDRPSIPNIEDYAELGTHLDEVMKVYIDTGKLVDQPFKDKGRIKETWAELFKATQDWVAKYNTIKFLHHSVKVHNTKFHYCGELDAIAEFKGEFVLCDFKKTKTLTKPLKEKYFMQMSAYIKGCADKFKLTKMIICSPYNQPIVSDEIDMYFDKFLTKRQAYKKRFGV